MRDFDSRAVKRTGSRPVTSAKDSYIRNRMVGKNAEAQISHLQVVLFGAISRVGDSRLCG